MTRLHDHLAIVSGSADGTVGIAWRQAEGSWSRTSLSGHLGAVTSVATGRLEDRSVLVSAGSDRTVRLWDLAAGDPAGTPVGRHDGEVTSVAVGELAGRPVVVSGGLDHTTRVWSMLDGAVRTIDIGSAVRGVAIAQEGRIAVGASRGPLLLDLSGGW